MITLNISLNDELAKIVENEVKEKKYASKSEFFRDLLRKEYVFKNPPLLIEEIKPDEEDYKIVKSREKGAEFVAESEVF